MAQSTTQPRAGITAAPVAAVMLPGAESPHVESTTCLGCHDGVVAAGGSVLEGSGGRSGVAGLAAGPSINHGHPIGMPYGGSRRDVRLRGPAWLDDRIRLSHDRVSCGSCHSPFSRNENHLVMTNARGELCLACHEY